MYVFVWPSAWYTTYVCLSVWICNKALSLCVRQVEWMSEKIIKAFEDQRNNPFQFKYLQLCHSLAELQRLPDPKVRTRVLLVRVLLDPKVRTRVLLVYEYRPTLRYVRWCFWCISTRRHFRQAATACPRVSCHDACSTPRVSVSVLLRRQPFVSCWRIISFPVGR